MIFKPILITKILCGEKTVTRRKRKPGTNCKYEVGKTYCIQPGMARPTIARIEVTNVDAELLGFINDKDAVLEGFGYFGEFAEYWEALYKKPFDNDEPVWRIEFHVVEVLGWICESCDGLGFDPITDPQDRAEFVHGAQRIG